MDVVLFSMLYNLRFELILVLFKLSCPFKSSFVLSLHSVGDISFFRFFGYIPVRIFGK